MCHHLNSHLSASVFLFLPLSLKVCFVVNVGVHSFSSVAAYRLRLEFTVLPQLRQTHCVACQDYLQRQRALETLPNKILITPNALCSSNQRGVSKMFLHEQLGSVKCCDNRYESQWIISLKIQFENGTAYMRKLYAISCVH